ncbi:MAG: hypothetical protein KA321_09060 [Pseudomonadales bacterium]|nr:hypothetical protein [Pseudomonadales bacterium]
MSSYCYQWLPPLSLFDGGAHPIHVYGIGAEGGGNAELGGSPKPLQCAPDLPAGVRRHIVDEASAGAWRLDVFHDRLPADAAAIDGANTGDDLPAAPVLVRSDDVSLHPLKGLHSRMPDTPAASGSRGPRAQNVQSAPR